MKILLIRHASVEKESPGADTLTDRGTRYSSRLDEILREKRLIPDVVFYDNSSKGGKKEIERCFKTIASLSPREDFKFFKFNEACDVMKDCQKYDVAAVCYTSESLKYFPKISNSMILDFTGNVDAMKPPEKITDKLYENILVIDVENGKYTEIDQIPTGDHR